MKLETAQEKKQLLEDRDAHGGGWGLEAYSCGQRGRQRERERPALGFIPELLGSRAATLDPAVIFLLVPSGVEPGLPDACEALLIQELII